MDRRWVVGGTLVLVALLTTAVLVWGATQEAPNKYPVPWRNHLIYGPRKFMLQHGWGKINPQRCAEMLRRLKHECDREGIEFCLADGTALGAIRQHDFIPNDSDTDVLCFPNDWNVLHDQVVPRLIRDHGFVLLKDRVRENGLPYNFVSLGFGGDTLDIQSIEPGGYCSNKFGPCNEILPTVQMWHKERLGDDEYWCPSIAFLELLFGKDWRIPQTRKKPVATAKAT